jgi:hypothetical protein
MDSEEEISGDARRGDVDTVSKPPCAGITRIRFNGRCRIETPSQPGSPELP